MHTPTDQKNSPLKLVYVAAALVLAVSFAMGAGAGTWIAVALRTVAICGLITVIAADLGWVRSRRFVVVASSALGVAGILGLGAALGLLTAGSGDVARDYGIWSAIPLMYAGVLGWVVWKDARPPATTIAPSGAERVGVAWMRTPEDASHR